MSAKLDITKPLRLIGIQIFENTLNNVRKALEPGWYPFIKCKQDIGSAKDLYPEVSDDGCPQDYYRINEDLPRISISAIVGKMVLVSHHYWIFYIALSIILRKTRS